jgi:hypothetical protein
MVDARNRQFGGQLATHAGIAFVAATAQLVAPESVVAARNRPN